MSIKLTQHEKHQTYYCTFTCVNWIPLFEITNLYDEIYNWFKLLNKSNNSIVGFVIMPNHMHTIIHTNGQVINTLLANGKRFMAYEIVKRLESADNFETLNTLAAMVKEEERKRGKKHRVFEVSSDIKPCYTKGFLLQKLNYLHNNPVSGKWNLAPTFIDYSHSSARFYELNQQNPKVKITHYEDIGDSVSSPAGDDT